MTKDEALNLARNLDGVIADVEEGDGFDDVCLDTVKYVRDALAEQPAQQDIEELTAQRDQLADILTRTANALKGQPAELSLHSWHDLPEVAQQLRVAQQQEPVAYLYHDARTPKDAHPWMHSTMLVLAADRRPGLRGETPLYTSPPASKPLTDEQILNLVPGLQDCLCDPWDYNNSGDYYASIPKDMIRLARAVEAAHGIKEKNHE